jgi:MYXO-CTERM domain-containing protein
VTPRHVATTLGLAALALPSTAAAEEGWQRTQTCYRTDPDPAWVCAVDEVPKGVYWLPRTVEYAIDVKGGDDHVSGPDGPPQDVIDAIEAGAEAWNEVGCSEFTLVNRGVVDVDAEVAAVNDCSGALANGLRICAKDRTNHIVWVDDWQYSGAIYALTSTTFNVATGEISDADIELNDRWTFATDSDPNHTDLQNTMTHEFGHFVGFDHNDDPESTMYFTAPEFETRKRTLEPLDEAGMCEVYPELTEAQRRALQQELDERSGEDQGCCATSPGAPRRAPLGLAALALGLIAGLRRRRR